MKKKSTTRVLPKEDTKERQKGNEKQKKITQRKVLAENDERSTRKE